MPTPPLTETRSSTPTAAEQSSQHRDDDEDLDTGQPVHSDRLAVIESMLCNTAQSVSVTRSLVADRAACGFPTFVLSHGPESNKRDGARKRLYKFNVASKMPVVKIPLADGNMAYLTHNTNQYKVRDTIKKFEKFEAQSRTYADLLELLSGVKWPKDSSATGNSGSNQVDSPSVAASSKGATSQRLPDSQLPSRTPPGLGTDPELEEESYKCLPCEEDTVPVFPTEARERQKEKEKSDKEKGIVRKVNKIKKHVGDTAEAKK